MKECENGKCLGAILNELAFDWDHGEAVLKLTAYDEEGHPIVKMIQLHPGHILLGLSSQYPKAGIFYDGKRWDEAVFVGSDHQQIYVTLESAFIDRPMAVLSIHRNASRYLNECDLMAVGSP